MLSYLLAVAVAIASGGLYAIALLFPLISRRSDLIWSGIGGFYALVLWVCANRIEGGLLLGQAAAVALVGWFGWQTLRLREQLARSQDPTVALPNFADPTAIAQQGRQRATVLLNQASQRWLSPEQAGDIAPQGLHQRPLLALLQQSLIEGATRLQAWVLPWVAGTGGRLNDLLKSQPAGAAAPPRPAKPIAQPSTKPGSKPVYVRKGRRAAAESAGSAEPSRESTAPPLRSGAGTQALGNNIAPPPEPVAASESSTPPPEPVAASESSDLPPLAPDPAPSASPEPGSATQEKTPDGGASLAEQYRPPDHSRPATISETSSAAIDAEVVEPGDRPARAPLPLGSAEIWPKPRS